MYASPTNHQRNFRTCATAQNKPSVIRIESVKSAFVDKFQFNDVIALAVLHIFSPPSFS